MTEPLVKVKRLAYVRVAAPDRPKAEEFLLDFGLQIAARTDRATYLRGTDAESHCYVLTEGPSDVLAIAFEVDSEADLESIARVDGASAIEKLDEPAGGHVVRLSDPNGQRIEIVHGQATLEPIECRSPGTEATTARGTTVFEPLVVAAVAVRAVTDAVTLSAGFSSEYVVIAPGT